MRSGSLVRAVALSCGIAATAAAAPVTTALHLDHFGYRPADAKVVIGAANPGSAVEIRRAADDAVVFRIPTDGGSIFFRGNDGPASGDDVWWIDFTPFAVPGDYRLYSPSLGRQSYDFAIREDVYAAPLRVGLKTFYYQRCNTPKEAPWADARWADPVACHTGDAATTAAPGHTNHGTLDLTGGWHDAGDYNKYVWGAVSAAILHMLRAFEDNPGVFPDGHLNIPESGNGVPDLLDEVKWELDWLLRMQRPNGSVLHQMHVPNFESDSPPSADATPRYYQNANLESGSVFAGTTALASRIFAAQGMTAYAATLKSASLAAWSWLETQGSSEQKVWAAAEVFRMDPTVTSARSFVDGFGWNGRFLNPGRYDTHAAITYVQTTGATASVVSAMRQDVSNQVDYIFSNDDLYRNGMPDWSYHWGSNAMRASYGLFLLQAAKLGATGSRTAQQCRDHALDFLRFFHGQNPLSMVHLTNAAEIGGEHSSFQIYHAWFGDSARSHSRNNFLGKPASVVEPDYPYYKGTDNHGVSDGKISTYGPAPGFVPGGPNKDYSGTAAPPLGATAWNRWYRDWADQTVWTARTWEITESSIGYQGPYVALAAYFVPDAAAQCAVDPDCDDGLFCNGAESCAGGVCQPGASPCLPGESCDEAGDFCFTSPCDADGVCEDGEDCDNCPADCGSGAGGVCGNGTCEPALGEDCLSCPADCAGVTGGKPSKRFCCGDGDGSNPVGCGDTRCTSDGFSCNNATPAPFCCGDGVCEAGAESICDCAPDCGAPAPAETFCNDGADEDCDGVTDCVDPECAGDPVCAAPPGCDGDGICEPGEDCLSCASDCAGRQGGKPSGRYCCGDGIADPPEGNGAICHGNL